MRGRGGGDLVDGEEGDHQPPAGVGALRNSGSLAVTKRLLFSHAEINGILRCEFGHKESKPTV